MSEFKGIIQLAARGFRGATSELDISFSPQQPFVLIFGENGSGKSSFVDAIEFALEGTKGSLADLASTDLADLASRGTSTTPLNVELQVGEARWVARLQGNRAQIDRPSAQPPKIEILRRSRLSKITAAMPRERFEEVKRFIDVEAVYRSEIALEKAVKDATASLEEAARSVSDAESYLSDEWKAAGQPEADAESWARTLSAASGGAALASARAWLQGVGRALDRLRQANQRAAETLAAEAATRHEIATLASSGEAPVSDDRHFVAVLSAAREALAAIESVTTCPVCRQRVDGQGLREEIGTRLGQLREDTDRLERRRRVEETLREQQAVARRAEQDLEEARRQIGQVIAEPPAEAPAEIVSIATGLAAEIGKNVQTASEASERLAALEEDLQEQESRQRRLEAERETVTKTLQRFDAARTTARRAERERDRLSSCLALVRDTRKRYTEEVLAEVEGEVNRLYEELHPEEGLGPIRMRLDERYRGSLHQVSGFGDAEEVPPQACFSESHLLTLAFCTWLALAKRERPGETILVLDDIVFAVDAAHTQRFAQLLAAEAAHFAQVLVTTHSRAFERHLRDGLSPSGRLDCRALRWTLRGGIVHGPTVGHAEQLASALRAPFHDRQGVASRAGVLLESILRQLAALYRRRVPFGEPTEPTLGELFNAWKLADANKLAVSRRGEGGDWADEGTVGEVLRELHAVGTVRNLVGAHFNTLADEVPDRDVEAYGRAVHDLWTLLVCPHCRQIPRKPKDDVFRCHCKRTLMRPNQID